MMILKTNIDECESQSVNHSYNIQRHNLITPCKRLTKSQKSYCYQQIKLLNRLPLSIRAAQ